MSEYQSEYEIRLQKLETIKQTGINPYPAKYDKRNPVLDIQNKEDENHIQTAGRLMSIRLLGKIIFAHLQDDRGRAQIALRQDKIGKDEFKFFQKNIDMGDFVGVEGKVFTTQKGEKTLLVTKYTFLGKALLPLPEKWHGIKDEEAKYRQRYLDLITNQETRERFKFRSQFIKLLREFYWQEGFDEVTTPVLVNAASGALAKPFITHHNALDTNIYLSIAPEVYLKQCIVGGYEKVFEVARCFRNEGMDPSHLQDFSMVEHYAAYWDFEDNMRFTEKMFDYILDKLMTGNKKIKIPDREGNLKEIDFTTPWPKTSFRKLLIKDAGIDIDQHQTADELRRAIKEKNIQLEDMEDLGRGNLIDALYKQVSRPKLINPVFLINHPLDLSPLARRNDENPSIVDRFQLLVNTWEIINAYSELVDPIDQEQRFSKQSEAKQQGDEEAHGKDDEYVESMKHGMPPISGWGMGVERIITLLTGQTNLRDVVLFPLMRPKNQENQENNKPRKQQNNNTVAPLTNSLDDINRSKNLGLNYDQAQKLVDQYITDEKTKFHLLESEIIMRALAKHFGEDEEKWGIVGLLHDIDWDLTKDNIKEHTVKAQDILKQAGATDFLINTIVSHAYGSDCGDYKGRERSSRIEHALAAAETATGIIFAAALMQPDKRLSSVKPSSLKKKFKDKRFAANCNREIILECEKIGLSLDEFLEISLDAMKGTAGEIGL